MISASVIAYMTGRSHGRRAALRKLVQQQHNVQQQQPSNNLVIEAVAVPTTQEKQRFSNQTTRPMVTHFYTRFLKHKNRLLNQQQSKQNGQSV